MTDFSLCPLPPCPELKSLASLPRNGSQFTWTEVYQVGKNVGQQPKVSYLVLGLAVLLVGVYRPRTLCMRVS